MLSSPCFRDVRPYIFSFCDTVTLAKMVSLVNKQWNKDAARELTSRKTTLTLSPMVFCMHVDLYDDATLRFYNVKQTCVFIDEFAVGPYIIEDSVKTFSFAQRDNILGVRLYFTEVDYLSWYLYKRDKFPHWFPKRTEQKTFNVEKCGVGVQQQHLLHFITFGLREVQINAEYNIRNELKRLENVQTSTQNEVNACNQYKEKRYFLFQLTPLVDEILHQKIYFSQTHDTDVLY